MKNKMTPQIEYFINKLQGISEDLYNEFNSISNTVEYECQLTRLIDDMQYFYCSDINDVIDETK